MASSAAAAYSVPRAARVAASFVALVLSALGCSSAEPSREAPPVDAGTSDGERTDVHTGDATTKGGGEAGDAARVDEEVEPPTASFDGALLVYPGECTIGEIGATFRGIPAFCQPLSASDDGFYQCDELANRFVRDSLQHPDLDNVVTGFASSICDTASSMSAYSVWGPDYRPTAGVTPVGGDLVVYPGVPGHVAVVVGFASTTRVTVIEQNAGSSTADEEWDPDASFFVDAECWVHAETAPPATLPSGTTCDCFTGGDTCGLAIVDHEWWNGCSAKLPEGGATYNSLYRCKGGAYTKSRDCPHQCITPNLFDASGYCGQ